MFRNVLLLLLPVALGCSPTDPDLVFPAPRPLERGGGECSHRVLLKADDVGHATEMTVVGEEPWRYHGKLSDRWVRFFEYILASPDLTANAGIIGRSIDIGPEKYSAQLAVLSGFSERLVFWNHGYTHRIHEDGQCEFAFLDAEGARQHLQSTQEAAARHGIELSDFGAPCNDWNDATAEAMDAVGLRHWYFGPADREGNIPRLADLEVRPGQPSLETLRAEWDPRATLVAIQLHPNGWEDWEFAEFEAAIGWMRSQGVCFITADEL